MRPFTDVLRDMEIIDKAPMLQDRREAMAHVITEATNLPLYWGAP